MFTTNLFLQSSAGDYYICVFDMVEEKHGKYSLYHATILINDLLTTDRKELHGTIMLFYYQTICCFSVKLVVLLAADEKVLRQKYDHMRHRFFQKSALIDLLFSVYCQKLFFILLIERTAAVCSSVLACFFRTQQKKSSKRIP